VEEIKKGAWIISPNGQPFRIIREENRKLWSGSKVETSCIVVVGIADELAQEIIIKKKDMEHYRDITSELSAIMEKYRDIAEEPDETIIQLEKDNRTLRIDLDKVLEEVKNFKVALSVAQESIEEKQAIINNFEGSAADIRKTALGQGVESIRKSYGGKKE
jgi:hypothetical protein